MVITNLNTLVANAAEAYITANEATFVSTVPSTVPGPAGMNGVDGDDGSSLTLTSSTNNGDGTFTLNFSDGSVHTTEDLTGLPGSDGNDGVDGESVTVDSVVFNPDYSMTISFSDGYEYSTPSIRGVDGRNIHHIVHTSSQLPTGEIIAGIGYGGIGDEEVEAGVPGNKDTYDAYADEEENAHVGEIVIQNGDSAYQYAVDGGFTGTQEEFITILGLIDDLVDTATNAVALSLANAELARKYAEEDEDVEVEAGKFSAKHWSNKAMTTSLAATVEADAVNTRIDDLTLDNVPDTITRIAMTPDERTEVAKVADKQDTLVSEVNIKTVNGIDILGAGNADIPTGSGGYAGNVYLTNQVSVTDPAYKQMSYTPDVAQTTSTAVTNANEVLLDTYIYDVEVDADSIPAGEWGFHFYRWVDNSAQETRLRFEPFKRSTLGVETNLFALPIYSLDIDDVVSTRDSVLITQSSVVVDPTDKIGMRVYISTTRNSNTTVSLQIGDGEASFFTTPLQVRHSLLRARDEEDSHPIEAITGLPAVLDSKVDDTEKGAALGVAELNQFGHVPESQLAAGGGDATKYLRGDGLWSAVAQGGGLGAIPFYRADGSRDDINLEALQTLIELTIANQLSLGNDANILVGNGFGWSDLKSPIRTGGGPTEPSLTIFRDGIQLPAFQNSKTDEFQAEFHINHDYAPGTKVYPHIHFAVNTTDTGTVRWGFEFTVAAGHHQAGDISVFGATQTVYVEQVIDGTQYKHYVTETPDADSIGSVAVDLAKIEPDSVIMVRVFRDGTHPNDTFNDNVFGITADLHQQVGRFSTVNKTPNFYN